MMLAFFVVGLVIFLIKKKVESMLLKKINVDNC